jgi:hypothetical protein
MFMTNLGIGLIMSISATNVIFKGRQGVRYSGIIPQLKILFRGNKRKIAKEDLSVALPSSVCFKI